MYRRFFSFLCVIILLFSVSSCKSGGTDELLLYGGDAVCYSYCVFNDRSQIAVIPLISNKKLHSVSLVDYQCDEKEVFSFTQHEFDAEDCFKYKGFYVFYLLFEVRAANMERIVHSSVDNIILNIDGEECTLNIPYFKICNGIDDIDCSYYNDGTLLFGGNSGNTLVYSLMPTKELPMNMGLVANKNVILNSFGILDYFSMSFCAVNSKECNPKELDFFLAQNDSAVFSCDFQYANGSDDNHIVRAARFVTFTDDGLKKAFIDGAGAYVYLGFEDKTVLKNYIDSIL